MGQLGQWLCGKVWRITHYGPWSGFMYYNPDNLYEEDTPYPPPQDAENNSVWLSPGNHHNKDRAFLFPVYVMPWIKMATTEKKWLPEAITPWKRQNSIGEFLCTIHKYGILNGVKWNSLVYMYITMHSY